MNILINQIGYMPEARKVAAVRGGLFQNAEILNEKDQAVLCVPVSSEKTSIWGDEVSYADFSELHVPGKYVVKIGDERSYPFEIAKDVYGKCLTALVDMFYYQRCGCDLSSDIGAFKHSACHMTKARVYGTQEYREVSGGWHDAGDFGRYIVPAAKAVCDLLIAYEWNKKAFEKAGITEIIGETKWELMWMLKMQREDGGVYHKATCASFCDMIMPDEEKEEIILSPVSTTATGDFAACMAMAYRFYKDADGAFALEMKNAAVKAWEFLQNNGAILFKNPAGITTGEYGDDCDQDERLWAAIELFRLTGEKKYEEAALSMIGDFDFTLAPLGWADVSGYAAIEGMDLEGELGEKCRQWVKTAAESRYKGINAYGIAMTDSLPWGSNMDVSDDGMLFYCAWKLTGDEKYREAMHKQLNYILGVNPMGYSYVSGFGTKCMRYPHHRPSIATGVCQPGMLSGGPASGMMDPVAKEFLQGKSAGKSYIDDHGSYSTNEICVYWNSPLVALMAAVKAE